NVEAVLTPRVFEKNLPLRDLTDECDRRFTFPPGASLAVVRHLIACGRWQVNMTSPIQVPQRLNLIGIAEPSISLQQTRSTDEDHSQPAGRMARYGRRQRDMCRTRFVGQPIGE